MINLNQDKISKTSHMQISVNVFCIEEKISPLKFDKFSSEA